MSSPITALRRELLPEPTSPMMQTNSPCLMVIPMSFNVKKASNVWTFDSSSFSSDEGVLPLFELFESFLAPLPFVFF